MVPRFALLAAVVALLAGPAAAHAGCGGTVTAEAGKKLGDFDSPLIIGDSVLLGAVKPVARIGFEVNTRGCRSWSEGAKIVRRRKKHGHLPHLVAMFLGADWEVSVAQIRETLFRLGPKRVLVLVTPREVGGAGGPDAQNMRDMAAENPHRILLLDWVRYSRGKSSWFAPDGIHLGFPGIDGLAKFLKGALPFAAPGAFPGPAPEDPAPEPAG
ncbi:MAG: hypothetical protein ACJ762_21445 [Solirubrobacteraceae bacterium]